MKSDKILEMIPKLAALTEENLERINNAVDACVVVQVLKDVNVTTNNMERVKL